MLFFTLLTKQSQAASSLRLLSATFAQWLGRMSYDPALQGNIELPAMIPRSQSEAELCEHVFPAAQLMRSQSDPDFFASRAILAVRNVDLKELNKALLEVLPGDVHTLYSVDQAEIDTALMTVVKSIRASSYRQLNRMDCRPLSYNSESVRQSC